MLDRANTLQDDLSGGKALLGSPGIVVLSPSLQMLHINRQAISLAGMLGSAEARDRASNHPVGILPSVLTNLAGEILRMLRSRKDMSDQEQFEMRYEADNSGSPILIRGVGVPNRHGVQHARIVLLLTKAHTNHLENPPIPV